MNFEGKTREMTRRQFVIIIWAIAIGAFLMFWTSFFGDHYDKDLVGETRFATIDANLYGPESMYEDVEDILYAGEQVTLTGYVHRDTDLPDLYQVIKDERIYWVDQSRLEE